MELAGLVRDVGLHGQRGICMGRALDGKRWLIATLGEQTSQREDVGNQTCRRPAEVVQREATSAVPLKGHDGPPSGAND